MYKYTAFIVILTIFSLSAFCIPGDKENHALIIIDMQPKFVTRGGNHNKESNVEKVENIITTQLEAINVAKASGIPIVFLEYENYGDTNNILKNAVGDYENTKFFLKNTDGMFSQRNKYRDKLISYLEDEKIGTLVITGANGGACVKSSIGGSLEEGYNVVAYSEAIADFNFKDFIHPYDNIYKFKPEYCLKEVCSLIWFNCRPACNTFTEIDTLPAITLMVSNGNVYNDSFTGQEINNAERQNISKEVEANTSKGSVHKKYSATIESIKEGI
jgi:nicotinamidase-related amidase